MANDADANPPARTFRHWSRESVLCERLNSEDHAIATLEQT